MKRKVQIVDDTEDGLEILASSIKDVAAAAKKIIGSKLSKRAILVLIKDSMGSNASIRQIEAVLDHASQLDVSYLRHNPEKKAKREAEKEAQW